MRQFGVALLIALVSSSPLFAQTVKLPAEVKVAPGRLAAVTINWEGDDLKWDVHSDLDSFREYDTEAKRVRIRLIGYTPGKYRLLAVAAKTVDGKAKLSDFGVCVITIEGTPPVPPVPPVPPTDPLLVAMQGVFATEAATDKATLAKSFASLYRQAATEAFLNTCTNWGEVYDRMYQAAAQLNLKGKLTETQKVIQKEEQAKLPASRSKELDAAGRKLAADTFSKIANCWEGLK